MSFEMMPRPEKKVGDEAGGGMAAAEQPKPPTDIEVGELPFEAVELGNTNDDIEVDEVLTVEGGEPSVAQEQGIAFAAEHPKEWRGIVDEVFMKFGDVIVKKARDAGYPIAEVSEESMKAALNGVLSEPVMAARLNDFIAAEGWADQVGRTSVTGFSGEAALAIDHLIEKEKIPTQVVERLFPH